MRTKACFPWYHLSSSVNDALDKAITGCPVLVYFQVMISSALTRGDFGCFDLMRLSASDLNFCQVKENLLLRSVLFEIIDGSGVAVNLAWIDDLLIRAKLISNNYFTK